MRLLVLRMSLLTGLVAAANPAFAGCTAFGQVPTGSPFVLSTSYDPTSSTATVASTTFTVTPPSGMSPPCTVYVVLQQPQGLANGASRLTYLVGGDLGNAFPSFPGAGTSSLFFNLQPGIPQTFSVLVQIPARQNVPAGTYTEALDLRLNTNNGNLFLSQVAASVSASVVASCVLPTPSASSLNFSSGVATGRVTGGYKLTSLIQGASCSGPAQLILRGLPMRTGTSASVGFDTAIHYQAVARLGSGVTTLTTDSASEALSTLAATSGTLSIDVSLIDKGNALAAGSYSSVLSVVLQPSN